MVCCNVFNFIDVQDIKIDSISFRRILVSQPTHKLALFNLACVYHIKESPIDAINFIEQYLRLDSNDMVAHSFLWSLTNIDEAKQFGIEAYRRLSLTDIKAAHKLAALTGEGKLC